MVVIVVRNQFFSFLLFHGSSSSFVIIRDWTVRNSTVSYWYCSLSPLCCLSLFLTICCCLFAFNRFSIYSVLQEARQLNVCLRSVVHGISARFVWNPRIFEMLFVCSKSELLFPESMWNLLLWPFGRTHTMLLDFILITRRPLSYFQG